MDKNQKVIEALEKLNDIAEGYDSYEYGLPLHNEIRKAQMIEALASLTAEAAEAQAGTMTEMIDEIAEKYDLYEINDGGRVNRDALHYFARALLQAGQVADHFRGVTKMIETDDSLTLNATQLKQALDCAAPDWDTDPDQRETEVTLQWMPERTSVEGEPMAAGLYLWWTDYPEEGVVLLDEEYKWEVPPQAEADHISHPVEMVKTDEGAYQRLLQLVETVIAHSEEIGEEEWFGVDELQSISLMSKEDAEFVAAFTPVVAFGLLNIALSQSAEKPAVPDELKEIGRLIATQDNRCTDQPMFIVQQKRAYVTEDGYNDCYYEWRETTSGDYSIASPQKRVHLEKYFEEHGCAPDGWMRFAMFDTWEFVTACFTEQGCKEYLRINGHNLNEPRIYADGSFRNHEYRTLRNWLLSLAAAPAQEGGK